MLVPQACLAYPSRHCLHSCRNICAHREGRREEKAAEPSISLSSTISLCQLTPFTEFQLSPDKSALCQIDSPPPDLDWENTVVLVYQRWYTSSAQKTATELFCPTPVFCHYLHSISVWPLVSVSQYDSPTQGITVQRFWASPDELGELPGTAQGPSL